MDKNENLNYLNSRKKNKTNYKHKSNNRYKNNSKNNINKKKEKKGLKIFLIILLIICIIIASYVAYSTYKNGWGLSGMIATAIGHDSKTKDNLEEFRVLLLGVSTDISSKLTDTIIVASYNPKNQTANLLSIPRDTYIGTSRSKADSYDKINSLYQKGPEKILEEVNEITGLDIKYYVVIETGALVDLVNAIGGVDFDVPIDMDYDDPTQDLHIHLKSGMQKLNGNQAEQVVRFRHNNNRTTYSSEYGNNDIGRMKTQRAFLTQVLKQTINLKNIFKINELIDIAYKNVQTNINVDNAKDYIPYIIEYDISQLQSTTLPGKPERINGLWFFSYNKKETKELVEELYYSDSNSLDNDNNKTSQTNDVSTQSVTSNKSDIKIELLNGSGKSSNLTKATNKLKQEGYNVYKTGTTSTKTKTEIKNKRNCSTTISNDIKDILGTGTVENNYNSSSTVDYTIIIGKDYKGE